MRVPTLVVARDLGQAAGQASALLLALLVTLAAILALATPLTPAALLGLAVDTLGAGFLVVLGLLVLTTVAACLQMRAAREAGRLLFWRDLGFYTAGGIATVALTWTLFGISLGIGTLAETELAPATIQAVIADLTRHFGMAFFTTIVGLPLATLLRAVVGLLAARCQRLLGAAAPATPD